MSTKFTENRNLFHTFSRVAIQEGQGVAAAVNKTGHTVTIKDIWADIDKLPKNTTYFGNANSAYDNLVEVYNSNSTEFSKYVTLYENVELRPVDGSGQDADKNQAWELVVNGKRVKNFVAPTDVFDNNGQPCNGYTLKLFDKTGTQIAPTDGNWAFDYVAGLVIFERGKTPQDMGWAGTTTGNYIKMSAWAYTGKYLDSTLDSHDDRLQAIEEELGVGGENTDSVTNRLEEIEATISSFTSENTVSSVITSVSSNLSETISNLSILGSDAIDVSVSSVVDTPVISLKLDETNSNAIEITSDGLRSFLELDKVDEVSGTTIQLKANGQVIDSFNLDLDKFVTSGIYIPSSEVVKLTFSRGNDVEIPVGALIDEYSGSNSISITDNIPGKNEISVIVDNSKAMEIGANGIAVVANANKGIESTANGIGIVRSETSEDFLYVNSSGIGLSGIQNAIDTAAGMVISGVATIPTTTEGFQYNTLIFTPEGETAIIDVNRGEVVDISEENTNEILVTTPSGALTTVTALTSYVTDYVDTYSAEFLSGVLSGNGISVSVKSDRTQSISINKDPKDGNAVEVTTSGLFVQAYEAGENISFTDGNNGKIAINNTYEYILPVAEAETLGGIKEGGDLQIDQYGIVTVLSANQVKHSLTFGGKEFNGSEDKEILASDLGALTGVVNGNNGITVLDGESLQKVVSLKVDQNDEFLYISSNGLATSGITEAITGYVDPKVTTINDKINGLSSVLSGYNSVSAVIEADIALADAIGDEADRRIENVNFLSSVLSGYTSVSAVVEADIALATRLTNVETQLGDGTGTDSVTARLDEVEKTISAYSSSNTISSAITAEASARTSAVSRIDGNISYVSGIIDTVSGDLDTAESKISVLETFKSSLRIQKDAVTTPGFAASYRLTVDGNNAIGDIINIPRDQFLSGAAYDPATQSLKLTFALSGLDSNGFETVTPQTTLIPISSLVHEYQAGAGIAFDSENALFYLTKDSNEDSKFLVINENSIGLSGISEAINAVGNNVTENITPAIDFISGVLSGYTSVSAVIEADKALSGEITTLKSDDQTSGSVLYAVRTKAQFADYNAAGDAPSGTIQYAIRSNTAAIEVLNGDATVVGSVDYKIDQYDNSISSLIASISNLNTQIEEGTIA